MRLRYSQTFKSIVIFIVTPSYQTLKNLENIEVFLL